MRGDPKPRNACAAYFVQKRARAVMLSRAEFDAYYERAAFADGPFVGAVDQRRYAHYPPRGQAFGIQSAAAKQIASGAQIPAPKLTRLNDVIAGRWPAFVSVGKPQSIFSGTGPALE